MTVRIGVCGATGRMGKTIIELVNEHDAIELSAAIEHRDSPMLGMDAGEIAGTGNAGIEIVDDISKVADRFDVAIDFTLAASPNRLSYNPQASKIEQ